MLFATILVAVFAYQAAISTPVSAAPSAATWNNNGLTYNNRDYTGPQTSDGANPPGLSSNSLFYTSYDQSNSGPSKGYLIYFDSNVTTDNVASVTKAHYQTGDYDVASGVFSNLSPPQDISIDSSTYANRGNTTSAINPTNSCNVDGVGWLVCPVSRWISNGMDYLYKIVASFLTVAPISTNTSGPMYQMWKVILGIANILFIIAFLILIYAQVSGGLLTNYTIKKTLPRIIIAAVLVNVSYWVCAVAVDVSNILGASVYDLMQGILQRLGAANSSGNHIDMSSVNWSNVTAVALGGGATIGGITLIAATGGGAAALGFMIIAALMPALFAVFVAVGVLAARQALITIFVVISPLAFVAYLLPNTEEWFTRWRKLFVSMLLMFPAFSVIFSGAQIAGVLIIQTAQSLPVVILGLVVQVVPLFITPFLIKLSSGILSTITGHINDRSKGVFDRGKNWANSRAEMHKYKNLARENKGIHRYGTGRMARRMYRNDLNRERRLETYKKGAENRAHEWEPNELERGPAPLRQAINNRRQRQSYGYWDDQYRRTDHKHHEIEAHHQSQWDRRFKEGDSRFDPALLAQEAETRKYTKTSEAAKASLDAVIREMEAGEVTVTAADIARHGFNKKRADDLYKNLKHTSSELQAADREIVVEGERKARADGVVVGQIAEMYDKNLKIRETDVQSALERAAGIDANATTKVRAKAKENIIRQYMENVSATGTILSSDRYEAQEQMDIIEKKVMRDGSTANEYQVFAALERTLTKNGNNWSAQKLLDYAATQGVRRNAQTGQYEGYVNGQLQTLTDEEVGERTNFQQMVKEYLDKSPLKVDYMSATLKSQLETGTFFAEGGQPRSEKSIIDDTAAGKYDQTRIVSADVDVLQRMVQVYRDKNNRDKLTPDARQKLLNSILSAQANPEINASIKPRERGVMNALASYLDDGDTRPVTEKESTMYYTFSEQGEKIYSYTSSDGQIHRVTADTPNAHREDITLKIPQNYSIDKLFDS